MRGLALMLTVLLVSPVAAEDTAPETGTARGDPSGIFSHGDSGDFVEDAFGRPPERTQPADDPARRKRDPGLRQDAPAIGR